MRLKEVKLNLFYILFIVPLFGLCFNAHSEELTVVYPEVKAPYDKIFQQITSGIESEFKGRVHHLKLPRKFDAEQQASTITTNKVIALGKRGMRIAKQLYKDKPVVVGALPIKPNGISGVSLMADPNILFESLHELAPHVTTITVLYSPASEWIISEAQIKANKKGLTLNPIAVDDIKAAVVAYNKIFEGAELETMAIWLPLDPVTANEKIIVPTILEKAWENKMVVFSSKPAHAKRGALFSALPDNEILGQQLARLINSVNYKSRPSTVNTLEKIKLAVNLRTAAHLGFDYDTNERSGFALTFPN
jgi:putative ABC transport system substrate-binding protein